MWQHLSSKVLCYFDGSWNRQFELDLASHGTEAHCRLITGVGTTGATGALATGMLKLRGPRKGRNNMPSLLAGCQSNFNMHSFAYQDCRSAYLKNPTCTKTVGGLLPGPHLRSSYSNPTRLTQPLGIRARLAPAMLISFRRSALTLTCLWTCFNGSTLQ